MAYAFEGAPGITGETFSNIQQISMNNNGAISFEAGLTGGAISFGIYQQTGTALPSLLVFDGQATPLSGGGNYWLGNSAFSSTLDNGAMYLPADVIGGTADHGEFLVSQGSTQVLMATADPLPANSNVWLGSVNLGGNGDYVGFYAQKAGGKKSLAVHNVRTQATSVLAADGDLVPGGGGSRIRIMPTADTRLNANGSVAVIGNIFGNANGGFGVFLATPGIGLQKIVANGDLDPATGMFFFFPSSFSRVNDAGQVGLQTSLCTRVDRNTCFGPSSSGLSVGSPGVAPVRVANLSGGFAPGGGTFSGSASLNTRPGINQSGQLIFQAGTTVGGVPASGIFLGASEVTLAKVVGTGDAAPGGNIFSSFGAPGGLNNLGEVAFTAGLTGTSRGGVFVGSGIGSPPTALALDRAAAPAGGNFSITSPSAPVAINDLHDAVFQAALTGGSSNSGLFVRRGPAGVLNAVILQGQPAPGTAGTFSNVGTGFQLGPDGDIALQGFFQAGGPTTGGLWHVKPDNTVEPILVRGTNPPEFGGGTVVSNLSGASWNSSGRYPVWGLVSGGTFLNAVFLFVPPISSNTPVGTNVAVTPTDATTNTTPVSLTFDNVTQAGNTNVTVSAGGPAVPNFIQLGHAPIFYNVSTSAVFSGTITICINWNTAALPSPALFHYDHGTWVNVTSFITPTMACGQVTSLSPFVVAQSLNSPPVANGGPDQTLECCAYSGASFTLDGSGSTDRDGDTLSYQWKDGSANIVGNTAKVTLTRPLGSYTFTLIVTDSFGLTSTSTTHVTVQDTTPPALGVTVTPSVVWPPDNKLVQVTVGIQVSDTCDPGPHVELVSVTSNEVLAPGDVAGAALGTDDRTFSLRATRAGTGTGRIYSITYRATDQSGNSTLKTAQVIVPHDQGNP